MNPGNAVSAQNSTKHAIVIHSKAVFATIPTSISMDGASALVVQRLRTGFVTARKMIFVQMPTGAGLQSTWELLGVFCVMTTAGNAMDPIIIIVHSVGQENPTTEYVRTI